MRIFFPMLTILPTKAQKKHRQRNRKVCGCLIFCGAEGETRNSAIPLLFQHSVNIAQFKLTSSV